MSINILVTGAGGQIGSECKTLARHFPALHIRAYDRQSVDITQAGQITRLFEKESWGYCINCAAYTAVDLAESEAERAQAINRTGAENLAQVCSRFNVRLIHFSTDYVYHNTLNRPLLETDPVTPQSIYAQTKLAGEEAILSILPEALILRTSWVYSSHGRNFVKTMLKLGKERASLKVVCDQIGTPTYARDLARACLQIILQWEKGDIIWPGGIFNYSNEGVCSWYDFALAIFELSGISCTVNPIESKDYPTAAPRPAYSVLNKTKFKSTFRMNIPYWREALARCLQHLGSP